MANHQEQRCTFKRKLAYEQLDAHQIIVDTSAGDNGWGIIACLLERTVTANACKASRQY